MYPELKFHCGTMSSSKTATALIENYSLREKKSFY